MRSARLIAATIVLCAGFQPASVAITINMSYFNEGDPIPHDENPTWDPAGTILKSHFQTAKAIWRTFCPAAAVTTLNSSGTTTSILSGLTSPRFIEPWRLDNRDEFRTHWFADPTPGTNEEFETTPIRLVYGTLSAADQSTYFQM